MRNLLFDGDMLVYRMTAAVEERSPFNKDILIKADPEEAWHCVELRIQECVDQVQEYFDTSDTNVILCFSNRSNYRKDVNPTYKSNREGKEKPVLYSEILDKCFRVYHCEDWLNIEADDVMGILQDDSSVIITGDKDLNQIPGYHLSLIYPDEGVYEVDEYQGHTMFLEQCLSGDSVDGYYGCPDIGKKKAADIIAKSRAWSTIVKTYQSSMSPKSQTVTLESGAKRTKKLQSVNLGLGESEALVTARCAYILRHSTEYNKETGEVNLWQPTGVY